MSFRKAYISLGANLGTGSGSPLATLEKAAQKLSYLGKKQRFSPLVRTPALLPPGAPDSWRVPFLNGVAELEWDGSPELLLSRLKLIERDLGREPAPRWAPRVIDLDLLSLGEERLQTETLELPHREFSRRAFVLTPWKELAPSLRVPGEGHSLLSLSRQLPQKLPLWMGILNLTPDSFSDGGTLAREEDIDALLHRWEKSGVQAIDLGAESTRPGALPVDSSEEWKRLGPALSRIRERYKDRFFRPLISVDTHHPETAEKAVEAGADFLNDVSGGEDPRMRALAKFAPAGFIAMHSLTVPADPRCILPLESDPVAELLAWAKRKREEFLRAGLSEEKLLLDPGIGFGKSAGQSLELIRRSKELLALPYRWLWGHSRKSFLQGLGAREVHERDGFTLGTSFHLAREGADWIRVHDPALHADAWDAEEELRS